jgi:hypothetical protein
MIFEVTVTCYYQYVYSIPGKVDTGSVPKEKISGRLSFPEIFWNAIDQA